MLDFGRINLMPSRIIREGILTSDRVDRLTEPAEVFYRRLMSVVDDFGRYFGKPSLLRSACYPLRVDVVGEDLINRHLAECIDAGLILAYDHASKPYLQMVDFKQQVRAKDSKFPAPPGEMQSKCAADAQQVKSNAHLDGVVVVVGNVSEGGDGGEGRVARQSRKTPLPAGFAISPAVQLWAAERGFTQLEARLEDFIGKAKAKGYTYVDWDHAFMNAVRNDWADLARKGAKRGKGSIHDQRADKIAALTGQSNDSRPAIEGQAKRVG